MNVSDWHAGTGSAPANCPPEYIANAAPSDGLWVKFCPRKEGSRLSTCFWDLHSGITPVGPLWLLLQEMLPPILACLWSGPAHSHFGFTPGRFLLDTCGKEQNSLGFYHCHLKMERDAWQKPVSISCFGVGLNSWSCPTPSACGAIPCILLLGTEKKPA